VRFLKILASIFMQYKKLIIKKNCRKVSFVAVRNTGYLILIHLTKIA
jgi:hypothetical protein